MRIPHTIPEAVLRVYEPSAEAAQLKGGEEGRTLRAEDFGWDVSEGEGGDGTMVPASLEYWCLLAIAHNFEKKPILDELTPCNRDHLLEILATDLPLELTVIKVPDGIYWRRCCEEKWDSMNFVQDYGDSWKRMYLERYLQEHLEKLPVEDYKLVEITNLMKLLSPYVHRLRLRELQLIKSQQELDAVAEAEAKAEKKKLADEEEILEVQPAPRPDDDVKKKEQKKKPEAGGKGKKSEAPPPPDQPQPRPLTPDTPDEPPPDMPDPCVPRHDIPLHHINLEPVIANLEKLQEFTVAYGIRDCGMEYRRELFQFSVQDMKNLGRGLERAYSLRVFRLTRSNLDDTLSPDLVRSLSKVIRLKILDLSHCRIGDNTACALGHLITKHPRIELIDLTNNCIGERGAKGLAYALQHPPCSPVRELHLRLNRIGDGGAAALAAMLERSRLPTTLNLAACDITSEGGMHLSVALRHNHTLRRLNLSNNPLGDNGGQHIESAMRVNTTLIDLDIRMTNMPSFREYVIMVEVDANNAKYRRLYMEIKEMLKKESEERILRGLLAKAVALETDEEWLGEEEEDDTADEGVSEEPGSSIYWQV